MTSSNPLITDVIYDPWGEYGPNGTQLGPMYGSPTKECGDNCASLEGAEGCKIVEDRCESWTGCGEPEIPTIPKFPAIPSALPRALPVALGAPGGPGALGGLGGEPGGELADNTPTIAIPLTLADTLGGEAARVREGIGQLSMVEVDLLREAPTRSSGQQRSAYDTRRNVPQFPWGQTRSYANVEGPDDTGINGNRWMNKELGYLDFLGASPGVNDPSRIVRRGLANESLWFELEPMSGEYAPLTAFRGQLFHDTDTFTFSDELGRQWVYFDNSVSHPVERCQRQ